MLRIAICDDEETQLAQTALLLHTYLQSRPDLDGHVETFPSGGALLARAEAAGGFDLYVLDILMPELSGIDTGRRLRALDQGGQLRCTGLFLFAQTCKEGEALPGAGRGGRETEPEEKQCHSGHHNGRPPAHPPGADPLRGADRALHALLLYGRHRRFPDH